MSTEVRKIERSRTVASIVSGPAGPGLPEGGTTGQLPAKASDDDYDVEWVDAATGGTGGGADGQDGQDGADGADGVDGASAYEVALANGFVGDEAAWLASLVGATGAQGPQGIQGDTGATGAPGADATLPATASQSEMETGTEAGTRMVSPLRVAQAIAALAPGGGGGNGPAEIAYKTADETVNNSSTFQDDDELTVPVAANTTYAFRATITYRTGSTPDIKFSFVGPTGATGEFSADRLNSRTGLGLSRQVTASASVGITIVWNGFIDVSTTAGSLTFRWAQLAANATDTEVLKGSVLELWEIA